MKPCAPRLANSHSLRAARTLGPSLQLRVPPASQINQPQPLHCHSLLRIPPKLPITNSSHLVPFIMVASLFTPYILGKANCSSFLTLTWNFVANTEPSTWNALPVSKCPHMTQSYRSRSDATPSLSFSSSQPEMRSPPESPRSLVSDAHCISSTCVSDGCLGNFLFCLMWRAGSCLSLYLQLPAECLTQRTVL